MHAAAAISRHAGASGGGGVHTRCADFVRCNQSGGPLRAPCGLSPAPQPEKLRSQTQPSARPEEPPRALLLLAELAKATAVTGARCLRCARGGASAEAARLRLWRESALEQRSSTQHASVGGAALLCVRLWGEL